MKVVDPYDRPVRPLKRDGRPFLSAIVAVALACALAFAAIPEFRDYVRRSAVIMGDAVGIRPLEDEYSSVYKRLGIPHLSAEFLASSKVSSSLMQLSREPCDKGAIFAFSEALLAAHEGRKAADAYSSFAATCPNSEGEQYRSAQIFLQLGDNEQVIALAAALIDKNPVIAPYHYLRGKAFSNVRRYAEALDDYKSAVELQKNPRDVSERVFVEMANIYAAMGRPCDSAATILAWVALDPSVRNTLQARRMIEEFSSKGCTQTPLPADIKKL
jgi:tetratricopeptide (TPR) repeat protein